MPGVAAPKFSPLHLIGCGCSCGSRPATGCGRNGLDSADSLRALPSEEWSTKGSCCLPVEMTVLLEWSALAEIPRSCGEKSVNLLLGVALMLLPLELDEFGEID